MYRIFFNVVLPNNCRYDWGALILADERFGRLPNIYAKGILFFNM